MNYEALKAELAADPLECGYAGMDDAAVAASLDACVRPAPVPVGELRDFVRTNFKDGRPLLLRIQDLVGGADAAASDAARIALDAVGDPNNPDINMANPTVAPMLAALAAAGAVDQAHADAIVALGNNRRSRADELGLGLVLPGDVTKARVIE